MRAASAVRRPALDLAPLDQMGSRHPPGARSARALRSSKVADRYATAGALLDRGPDAGLQPAQSRASSCGAWNQHSCHQMQQVYHGELVGWRRPCKSRGRHKVQYDKFVARDTAALLGRPPPPSERDVLIVGDVVFNETLIFCQDREGEDRAAPQASKISTRHSVSVAYVVEPCP